MSYATSIYCTVSGNNYNMYFDPRTSILYGVGYSSYYWYVNNSSTVPNPNTVNTFAPTNFIYPMGIMVDKNGIIYLTDHIVTFNVYTIPSGSTTGTVLYSGITGNYGWGIIFDSKGNSYASSYSAIVQITPGGVKTTLTSTSGRQLAIDSNDNLYTSNGSLPTKITVNFANFANSTVTTYSAIAGGLSLEFNHSNGGIALDGLGNIYVGDYGRSRICKIDVNNNNTVTVINDSSSPTPVPDRITGLAIDNVRGYLYAATLGNQNVYRITIPITASIGYGTVSVNSTSAVSTLATIGSYSLQGLALDNAGNIFTTSNNTFNKINLTSKLVTSTTTSLTSIKGMFFDRNYANLYVANTTSIYYSSNFTAATPTFNLFSPTSGTPSFNGVNNIAFDSTGNIYVTNYVSGGKGSIRKFTSAGVESPPYSSSGATSFSNPFGLAVDSAGLIYFTSTDIGAPIYKLNGAASSFTTTILGASASPAIVPSAKMGLTLDSTNNIFFCDVANFLIRKIDATSGAVTNIAVYATPYYNQLQYIATGSDLYITDFLSNSGAIRKIGSNTTSTPLTLNYGTVTVNSSSAVTTLATIGSNYLQGLTLDNAGNIYTTSNNTFNKIVIASGTATSITTTPTLTSIKGIVFDSGYANLYVTNTTSIYYSNNITAASPSFTLFATTSGTPSFNGANNIAFDTTGNIYVTHDYGNGKGGIRKFNTNGTEISNAYTSAAYSFSSPFGLAVDSSGLIYFTSADSGAPIYKLSGAASNFTTTILGGSANPAIVPSSVMGLTLDSTNNIFFCDNANKLVRRIDATTGAVTNIGILNIGFNYLQYIATGSDLYITDFLSNSGAIRKIGSNTKSFFNGFTTGGIDVITRFNTLQTKAAPSYYSYGPPYGTISLYPWPPSGNTTYFYNMSTDKAGNVYFGGYIGNYAGVWKLAPGTGTTPTLITNSIASVMGVAADAAGNIYVCSYNGTSTNQIYKIAAGTLAITNIGTSFTWTNPWGINVDSVGNVWVANRAGSSCNVILTNGSVQTISLPGGAPFGIAIDSNNNVYVNGNNTIYYIPYGTYTATALSLSPNPAFNAVYSLLIDAANILWVGDIGTYNVYRIDTTTLAITTVSTATTPASRPVGFTIANGYLYYGNDLNTIGIYYLSLTGTAYGVNGFNYYASTDSGVTYTSLYNGTLVSTTGFTFNGADISQQLVPYFSGSQAASIGLKYGGNDFNALFLPVNSAVPVIPNAISTLAYVASSVTLTTANFTFNTPTAPNLYSGLVANYYYPFYLNGSTTASNNARVTAGASSMTMQIYSLVSNTNYAVKITANVANLAGAVLQSSLSNSISILTIPDVPVLTLITQTGTSTSITVSVTPPNGNGTITSYSGYAKLNGAGNNLTSSNTSLTSNNFVFTGLTAANQYYCYLSASNSSGTGSYTAASILYTVPDPPTSLTFQLNYPPTMTNTTFSFVIPTGTVSGYNFYVNQTTTAWENFYFIGDEGTRKFYYLTNLPTPGTAYTLYVDAFNSGGKSTNVSTAVYTSPSVSIYSVSSANVSSSTDITQCNTTTASFNVLTTGAATSYVVYVNEVVGSGSISGSVYTVTGLTNTTTQNTSIYLVASNNGALSVKSNTMTMKQLSFFINSVTYNSVSSTLTVNLTFTGTLTKANFTTYYYAINGVGPTGGDLPISNVTLVSGSDYNISIPSAGTITTAGAVNYVTINFNNSGPTNYNTFYYSNSSGLRTVSLNFYPPSFDARSEMWTGQGNLIMARSLVWAAGGNTSGPLRVLFLHAYTNTSSWSVDVKNKVTSYISSNFPAISLTFNIINNEAPDASSLTRQNYDVAMVSTDNGAGANWGTSLNSFAQAKGGIVLCAFANSNNVPVPNFSYSSYSPIQTYAASVRLSGDVNLNTSSIVPHFITTGLTTFYAGTGLYGVTGLSLNASAQNLASYNSGTSLIAIQTFA